MKINIVIDEFSGSRLEIESVSEDTIVYRSTALKPAIGEVITPTKQQWEKFWSLMEQCRDWEPAYQNPGILDGTSWSVDVSGGGICVRPEGKRHRKTAGAQKAIECLSGSFITNGDHKPTLGLREP